MLMAKMTSEAMSNTLHELTDHDSLCIKGPTMRALSTSSFTAIQTTKTLKVISHLNQQNKPSQ
jgi:hypothetical protein